MATTLNQLLAQIAFLVQEDSSFSSGLWTVAELTDYCNVVMDEFIRETQITKQTDAITIVGGTRSYSEPSDSMSVDRIDFNLGALKRTNVGFLDLDNRKWRTLTGTPKQYHQDMLPNKTFELDRAPLAAQAGLFINVLSTLYPATVTTGTDNLTVPDYAVLYIKLGVLDKMLSKQGEAQDLVKAKYCKSRFDFGVGLFQNLMASKAAPQVAPITTYGGG